ncbi:MAG: hypothetical protein ABIJ08_05980 [Nanoarchaeota archaeon]
MVKMKMNKKGIYFTIAFSFLMMVVLALAILIFNDQLKSEEIVTKLSLVDRVYDLDSSLQQSMADIFHIKSNISINMSNTSIMFTEKIPNSGRSNFNNSMISFKKFVESNISNINITIDDVIARLPLIIMPYNITFESDGQTGINVIPRELNFMGYSISILLSENVTSCNNNIQAGTFNLSVYVYGQNENKCEYSLLIDATAENEISVNGNELIIDVTNNRLSISLNNETSMTAYTKTSLLLDTSNIYIRYPSPSISIHFDDMGVYKVSGVRII